ncbi:hypothetical protein [Halobacillus litoralis]|uniref:Lipoprotein n=1 Tax=Halobacillus litoralis TaxID=45668 RepID=A0A410MED7_9BACI|nr:hypothetical protein [Halobacillus litoralis]QAS52986.1 hypothetical protein HLI_12685 [Halobacillus litoralis]
MFIRFFLIMTLGILVTGCENKEDKQYELKTFIEKQKPIGIIDIRDDSQVFNANEEAKTSRETKVKEFISIVENIKLKKIKKDRISEWKKEMNRYSSEGELLDIVIQNKNNKYSTLFLQLTSDGKGMAVNFEDGGSTDVAFKVENGKPETYEEVYDFYKSIYEKKTIEAGS